MMDDMTQKTWIAVFELVCLLIATATLLARFWIL